MKEVVIAGYVRSPFTFANKGELAKVRPDDIAAQVVRGLVEKTGVNPKDIEDLILGCAFPEAEQGFNVARIIAIHAGLPIEVGGTTVNRFCGSSMQAIHMAAGAIQCGAGEVYICAGVESMSRVPMTGFNPMPNPQIMRSHPEVYMSMGDTAENVAKEYQITREKQQDLAVVSHERASKALKEGKFKDEIIPIKFGDQVISQDGCIRTGTSQEKLSELKPVFNAEGTVTAGTASPLTDGAAATLVTTLDYAKKHKLPILAKIKSFAIAGLRPEVMGLGPIFASRKALERAGLKVKDIDVIELNEAFSSQAWACIQELGLDLNKVNIDGGALALGHPLGATGARITGKAAQILKREGGKYALATQCIGGGQGIATILESVS